MIRAFSRYFTAGLERDGRVRRQVGDDRHGQDSASGRTSRAVPRNDAHVAGEPGLVSGRVLVDGPGQVVLAPVVAAGQVRSVGDDQLQLAARHVVHTLNHPSAQPVALALLVSVDGLNINIFVFLCSAQLFFPADFRRVL